MRKFNIDFNKNFKYVVIVYAVIFAIGIVSSTGPLARSPSTSEYLLRRSVTGLI